MYNPFTKSVFFPEKYDVSSIEHPLMIFNICLVRKVLDSKKPEILIPEQEAHFEKIYTTLISYKEEVPSFMTKARRIDVFGEDI